MENEEKLLAQDEKLKYMTTAPINGLVVEMAIPSMISMMITAVYNLVDTMYVGRISTEATAAVGVIFSFMAICQATGFFFGHGSGTYISRALGKKDRASAEKMAATGFVTAFVFSTLLAIVCAFIKDEMIMAFGGTLTLLDDARSYFKYILYGTPFCITSFVLNNQMRLQGNARRSVFGISIGAVLNIILDPIFIFALKMGVGGAALATSISQFISFMMLLKLSGDGDGIKIKLNNFEPSFKAYREIVAGGAPSFLRQAFNSLSTIVLNRHARIYGDVAIAAFAAVNRIMGFSTSLMIGFGQGFQPVCGFNYGAGKNDRVKKAFWFMVIVTTVYAIIFTVVGFIFSEGLVRMIRPDDLEMIALGSSILRWQLYAYPLVGTIVAINMLLQNTRKAVRACIAAAARCGLFMIPSLYVLEHFMGFKGVMMSQMTGDIISFVVCLAMALYVIKYDLKDNVGGNK